jgi:hypothetical protein
MCALVVLSSVSLFAYFTLCTSLLIFGISYFEVHAIFDV